jgi:hypothetical protein
MTAMREVAEADVVAARLLRAARDSWSEPPVTAECELQRALACRLRGVSPAGVLPPVVEAA